ncbi:SNF2-related protein [Phascolarctobacterium succinatutens]|uniref:SNF2-related protein n=1 Tax=Phascolarctobacterium succinatutens TaxID=626940 RepID=UPI002E79507E|nr:SNF2-related protein [Phascolarctobacterium succinatutens]MEE0508794.1 SNF2-related protein [Phascolarctobacterium succinatutens]
MQLPAYRAFYLDKMLEQNADLYTERDSNFRRLIKEFKVINESDFEVPPALAKIMRNYQEYGYKWLRTLAAYGFGGVLADDMGLGKTLQSIAVLAAAKEAGEEGTSLIVCPASLIYNWQEEFTRLICTPNTGHPVLGVF